MEWFRRTAQEGTRRFFAPGEDPSKFGTPAVDVVGPDRMEFVDIPGVEGHVNLQVSVDSVRKALERAFGSAFFYPITTIRVADLPGKFGQAVSTEPHTIYVNTHAMVDAIRQAVAREAAAAAQGGVEARFTPEIGNRINAEVAKLLWETIPHERRHALDFQAEIEKMYGDGGGDVSSVQESAGERAGKEALGRFNWYVP